MKKLLSLCSVLLFLASHNVNAQNCDGYEIRLNQQVQKEAYEEAYPIFIEAMEKCADKKVSYYIFGEKILDELAKNATTEDERKKYATQIVDLLQKRINLFPNDKPTYWEGERINYELNYQLKDNEEIYKEYKKLFDSAEAEKLSTATVLNYYTTALQLLNDQVLQFDDALNVYFKTKEVTEKNIELRSREYGELAEKLDSLQTIDPSKKLSAEEEQKMANAQNAKNSFLEIQDSMESILAQYTTCENLSPMYINKFEANRDSLEWLITSYQQLASRDCYDLPIMETIEKQYAYLWKKQNPQAEEVPAQGKSEGAIGSKYAQAAKAYSQKNYSNAIKLFQEALNEVSGGQKGDVAYYIAVSYQKIGQLSNAVSWAKKAVNYKPGYGAPYELIAGIFGSNANNCGNNTFEKLTAYWVAADFANKACAVDSRSCGRARSAASSYNANGPSLEMAFQQGKKKGDRVSISCFGGATTTVR